MYSDEESLEKLWREAGFLRKMLHAQKLWGKKIYRDTLQRLRLAESVDLLLGHGCFWSP